MAAETFGTTSWEVESESGIGYRRQIFKILPRNTADSVSTDKN